MRLACRSSSWKLFSSKCYTVLIFWQRPLLSLFWHLNDITSGWFTNSPTNFQYILGMQRVCLNTTRMLKEIFPKVVWKFHFPAWLATLLNKNMYCFLPAVSLNHLSLTMQFIIFPFRKIFYLEYEHKRYVEKNIFEFLKLFIAETSI